MPPIQMTQRRVVWTVVLSGGVVAVGILAVLCFRLLSVYSPSRVYHFSMEHERQLAEKDAINYTRKMLVSELPGTTKMWPVPSVSDERLHEKRCFATSNNRSGYVIWNVSQQGRVDRYLVHIEIVNGEITGRVSACK